MAADPSAVPRQLRYTAEHEWLAPGGPTARIGITEFAQNALGDVVYVSLPPVGSTVAAGESIGEIESTKSVSELYAPVAGTVAASNEALADSPGLINADPYGDGWLIEITLQDPAAIEDLLDADGYAALG